VLFEPEPRSVTFDLPLNVIIEDKLKVPAPSRTNWFAPHAAMAELMVEAVPEYAAMVEPHCVRLVEMPPGTPTLIADQSIARFGDKTPVHC
jgi:hypothetical protein